MTAGHDVDIAGGKLEWRGDAGTLDQTAGVRKSLPAEPPRRERSSGAARTTTYFCGASSRNASPCAASASVARCNGVAPARGGGSSSSGGTRSELKITSTPRGARSRSSASTGRAAGDVARASCPAQGAQHHDSSRQGQLRAVEPPAKLADHARGKIESQGSGSHRPSMPPAVEGRERCHACVSWRPARGSRRHELRPVSRATQSRKSPSGRFSMSRSGAIVSVRPSS